MSPFTSFLNGINKTVLSLSENFDKTIRAITLNEAELERLKIEVRELKVRALRYEELRRENYRMKNILAFAITEPRQIATAKVISRGAGKWHDTLTINKGQADGVMKNMAVITPEGLLGKIISSKKTFARILLLDNTRFSVAVRLQSSRSEGVLTGAGKGRAELKYIGTAVPIKVGDRLITSGLDAMFPPGISAGIITKYTTDKEELFHYIEANTFVDTSKAEEVIIISR